MDKWDLTVVGAGAAGCMAAITAAENGKNVLLIERNEKIGRKLMITGKGRCNVTNNRSDIEGLISSVPGNGKFLYSAFSEWMPSDTIKFFEGAGVKLKTERGNRVFPVSDKASDIVDALNRLLKKNKVKTVHDRITNLKLSGFSERDVGGKKYQNSIEYLLGESGEKYFSENYLIATGGKSYPGTGSTGDGYELAKKCGHKITPVRPSLVALNTSDSFTGKCQGLTLKNTGFRLLENGKTIFSDMGELLFTHFGVSGPLVLSSSAHIRRMGEKDYEIILDLKPALDEKTLDNRICRDFSEFDNREFKNCLSKLLPKSIIPVIVELSGIDPDKKVNVITREERRKLVSLLKNFTIHIKSFRPVEEAIVCSGGVSVKEIDPKTMRSKITDNLFFAGEVIDVDAYTGGYNLQSAFATGHAAGEHI